MIETKAGIKNYVCAYCDTELSRQMGLMGQRLPPHHGAVLAYPEPVLMSLWMKNCLQPLVAVFIADDRVVHACTMDHNDPNRLHHCPTFATTVLEMNPSEADGIALGDIVRIFK